MKVESSNGTVIPLRRISDCQIIGLMGGACLMAQPRVACVLYVLDTARTLLCFFCLSPFPFHNYRDGRSRGSLHGTLLLMR